jgi:hypothetical protein
MTFKKLGFLAAALGGAALLSNKDRRDRLMRQARPMLDNLKHRFGNMRSMPAGQRAATDEGPLFGGPNGTRTEPSSYAPPMTGSMGRPPGTGGDVF